MRRYIVNPFAILGRTLAWYVRDSQRDVKMLWALRQRDAALATYALNKDEDVLQELRNERLASCTFPE